MFDRIRALSVLGMLAVLLAGCDAALLQRGRLPEPGTRSGSGSDLPDAEVVDLNLLKAPSKSMPAAPVHSVAAAPRYVEILDDSPTVSVTAAPTKIVEALPASQRDIHAVDCSKERVADKIQKHAAPDSETEAVSAPEDESVTIAGAIMHPGTYFFKDGMPVSALIRSAGGFMLEANLRRAVIVRPLSIPAAFTVGERSSHMREITIPVDLAAIVAGDKDADIALNRLDTLKILSNENSGDTANVTIVGGVRKPGVYKLTPNLTLGQLIQLAGGPTSDAVADDSRITREKHSADDVRASSVTYKFRLSDIRQHLADYDLTLENHDQITVNSQPSR